MKPDCLTKHMEDTILDMTLDRFNTAMILAELRRYYPRIKERDLTAAIAWVIGSVE